MYLELTYRILIKILFSASHSAAVVVAVSSGIWKKIQKFWQGQREEKREVKSFQDKKGWPKRMEIQQSMLCALYPQKILKRNAS